MIKDLRYIENLIEDKEYSSHPSDKQLADFIDNKLESNTKNKVVEHLIHCFECREVVNEVVKYKKKPNFINNINIAPFIMLVASLVLFIVLPFDIELIGKIDLLKNSREVRGEEIGKQDKIIDGDKFVEKEISSSTDVSYIEEFNQAKETQDFDTALNLYQMAINNISDNENISDKERLKQKIVIRRSILERAIEEDNKVAIDSYRNRVKDDIRTYYFQHYKEMK